ncbi:transcriptional regulator, LysR family [Anaeromyxobacter dehalogenans 2CP-1]|uniref:Transcriptional regulator, LysR family n=1 Tax=Anaeromyxobacter dehalogenans (strain ATCC BAA-258 / DSM 21875 / 2CP-1) TaxID=455488 RepID=B8J798_ANAD2|nr:transcriptional activator NhaR [Anaeromyxobacter dehalogenans]ACL65288.1 transcriptional regulator, LysR family [Anaeromyxobacter dehalogenans 2CP-1]
MEWLNYHHLFYFWTVARAGSIARASEELRLAQPTISNQLKTLEANLGVKLLERQGRRLVLTDVGRTVLRYADDIFRTGRELQRAVKGLPTGQRLRLVVGVADVIPKRMAALLLQPAVDAHPDLTLVCREGPLPQLLAALALHELDVVIADVPAPEDVKVKAFSHRLGDCGTSFLAARPLAHLKKGFPRSLQAAPMLLPSEGTALRRGLDTWLERTGVRPVVAGEFDDSALMQAFGARGLGVFAAPRVLEDDIRSQLEVGVIGRAEDVREAYHAITVERRLRHPAVVTLAEAARDAIFGAPQA